MPNENYSYQGWNPGQGMSDFASTMRQGYLDQQALRQHQFENLIQGEKTEADLQHPISGDAVIPSEYLDTKSVNQGEQEAASVATANQRKSYIVNPQTNSVQEVGGQPSGAAPQARSMSQPAPGQAPAPPIDPSKFEKDEQGNLVDGKGNPIDGHVVLAAQRLGGYVDPDTGAVHVPGYMAKALGAQFDKNQSALAQIGTAAFRGGLVNAPQVHMVPPPRAASAAGKDPLDAAYKSDPILQGYYRTLSSNAALSLSPEQRNNFFNLIQQRQQQIQQHFSGGQSAPAPNSPPGGHTPQDVQNAIKKYMQKYPHATPQQAEQAAQQALGG